MTDLRGTIDLLRGDGDYRLPPADVMVDLPKPHDDDLKFYSETRRRAQSLYLQAQKRSPGAYKQETVFELTPREIGWFEAIAAMSLGTVLLKIEG